MGLALVHGIVKRHGGSISVVRRVGQGTTFSVFLPTSDKAALPEEAYSGSLPGGCERIMFVDDEKASVDLGRQILERIGYQVKPFTSSMEAYSFFCQNAETIDLLITDLTMPEMTGKVLAEKILAKSSKVPIIICMGYSENFSAQAAYDVGFKGSAMKQLFSSELAISGQNGIGLLKANF